MEILILSTLSILFQIIYNNFFILAHIFKFERNEYYFNNKFSTYFLFPCFSVDRNMLLLKKPNKVGQLFRV